MQPKDDISNRNSDGRGNRGGPRLKAFHRWVAAVFVLGAISLTYHLSYATILEKAASNIEKYRKGQAVVELRQVDGSKAPHVTVHVRQLTHDFLFGSVIRPRYYHNEQYLNKFKELFNFAELLEFNWGQYEPDEGKPLFKERLEFIKNWCLPNGIRNFYGHMLVWSSQYGQYPKTNLPEWLFNYDRATQRLLLRRRIERELKDYKGINMIWDVVNEPSHTRVWGDWDKPNYSTEPVERVVPYVSEALKWAHQAVPEAPLLVNEYRVIVDNPFRDRFRDLLRRLKGEKAPLSAVGIQAHEPNKGKYWYSPEELWSTYNLFGEKLKLPIYITEFLYVSDPHEAIRGQYRSGNWNETLQADAIEEFYRVSFGHPRVKGIIYFALSDNDAWMPKSGLLDEQYAAKPAWNRLERLLRKEWVTESSGETGSDGAFQFRGFFGEYRIRVEHDGTVQDYQVHLREGVRNRWIFTLN